MNLAYYTLKTVEICGKTWPAYSVWLVQFDKKTLLKKIFLRM